MDKWEYMRFLSFCTRNKMVSILKRPPTEWEKIITGNTSVYTPRIYRELKKLNYPQINELIKKWETELNRTFSMEEVQIAKKHEKMFTMPGHIGNANQNHTDSPHSYSLTIHSC
jgi:hypothetical protein